MSFEEFLKHIRSGLLDFTLHYLRESDSVVLTPYKCLVPSWDEVLEVIRTHQQEIVWLIARNDWNVCVDLEGHSASHKASIWLGGSYVRCDACALARDMRELTDEDCERRRDEVVDLRTP
jgi:hypothetical protein